MSAPPAIAVLDYGPGNLASVVWGVQRAGGTARIVTSAGDLTGAAAPAGLILPGVGSFGPPAQALTGPLGDAVRAVAGAGRPILGICLGMQLLFQWSEEDGRASPGLGLLDGGVRRLDGAPRLPHMGWNRVRARPEVKADGTGNSDDRDAFDAGGGAAGTADCTVAFLGPEDIDARYFYFAHSYVAFPRDGRTVLGEVEYGEVFPAVVGRGNVAGVQFHPERSGAAGRAILERFVTACSR